MDDYAKFYIERIKGAQTDEELAEIVNDIHREGYWLGSGDAEYYYEKFMYASILNWYGEEEFGEKGS